MARSLLVVLPMAETTTIGWSSARAGAIAATRSMAAADSTEVPANFMTIMTRPWPETFRRLRAGRKPGGRLGGAAPLKKRE